MARVTKYKALYPWTGGLNTSVDPVILDNQKLTVADNVIFTNSASRKKRGGQARHNSTKAAGASTANFVYLADYWANVSSTKTEALVGVSDNGKVLRDIGVTGTWTSFSTLTLSVSQGGVTHTVQNEDLILGIRGSGVPKVWAGMSTSVNLVTLTSTSGALPFSNGWIVANFLERLFVAGDPANPDNLYISKSGDYKKWTSAATAGAAITLTIGQGDGDPTGITSIFTGNGADRVIYVGKRRHLYRIDCSDLNQTNWKVSLLSKEIGVVHHNAVATIDLDDVMFASDRGIHALSQIVSTTAIIDGEFLSFPIQYDYNNVIEGSSRAQMSAVYYPAINSYLLGCKRVGKTTMETVYGFNVELKQWFRWTSVPCNHLMRRFNKTTGLDELYAAAGTGYVNKLQQTALNDFGSAIVTTIRSTFITPTGIPFTENQFTNLACIYRAHENSSFTVNYSVDGLVTKLVTFQQRKVGSNILGTTLLGSGFILGLIQAIKPVWNHLSINEGNSLQLTFTQNGNNEDFELFGIVLEYTADEESQNAFNNPAYGH